MKSKSRKILHIVLISGILIIFFVFVFVRWGNDIARSLENDNPSRSTGTTKDGQLVNGKRLPTSGANFQAYGYLPIALGRNSLHGKVRSVVLDAYKIMEKSNPLVKFVYAECSWPSGGRLRPHATHRNGLSIDFMVPVKTSSGPSIINTGITNKYGYSIYFDEKGYCASQKCQIDFNAMASHLNALHQASERHGLKIWRVIFDPKLQSLLFKENSNLPNILKFSKKASWVRHDEHYHVDFINPDIKEIGQQKNPGD